MGFRDFFSSFHSQKDGSISSHFANPDETKSNLNEKRQAFLDSLKVDVSEIVHPIQNDTKHSAAEQGDGRDRGDELTHSREDSLKMDTNEQAAETDSLESSTTAETDSSSEETDNTDTDDMTDGEGLSL